MELVKTIDEVRKCVKEWKMEGKTVGFVPTMGYLHEGHKSLIERANKENDKVVVSIFVNPSQFGPNEDLESYPRDIDRDSKVCKDAGADLIFNPEASEIYTENACTKVNVEGLSNELCGKSRPVHFGGVCLVVGKLFNIVAPDKAYFGQKDAQQLAVVKKMVSDLNFDIKVIGCPIVREADGLAKSSRNTYLSKEEREAAVVLSQAINIGKEAVMSGEKDVGRIKDSMIKHIENEPLAKIDYVDIVDFNTIQKIDKIEDNCLCAIAAFIGKTRLIDNFIFENDEILK